MTTAHSENPSEIWHSDANEITLKAQNLSASIDLLNPCSGLSNLVLNQVSHPGFTLGVTPGTQARISAEQLTDVFIRGNDLVVTYVETDKRPFSLQVYWRATSIGKEVLLLDTILSMQTDLLESFPSVAIETRLPAQSALLMSNGKTPAEGIDWHDRQTLDVAPNRSDSLLIRLGEGFGSYAEATHPEDRGATQIENHQNMIHVTRKLGGRFLEKGVIRRLRVRGIFMPSSNDHEVAAHHLAKLATEEPPLTT